METINRRIVKQAKWLTQALLLSGALNIGLLLAIFSLFVKEHLPVAAFDHKPIESISDQEHLKTNGETLRLFEKLSFDQLMARLEDTSLVEDGFAQRDLALGLLVSSYHFNLEKALARELPKPRVLVVEGNKGESALRVMVFPGLTDEDFKSAAYFAKREAWPLTSQGLFLQLQKLEDPVLLEAFALSSEFAEVEALFSHMDGPKDRSQILSIILSGDWQMLDAFAKGQKGAQDFSAARQQRFLLDYVARGSKPAAEYMLYAHGAFAVKKFDDAHVIAMLQLLTEKNAHAEAFAKALLISPRSDSVWKLAADRLYRYAGEEPVEPYNHMQALNRFIPQEVIKEKTKVAKAVVNKTALPQTTKPAVKKARTHVVEEGETLWVIAKKYKTDTSTLKKLNDLKTDTIRKGKTLKLP